MNTHKYSSLKHFLYGMGGIFKELVCLWGQRILSGALFCTQCARHRRNITLNWFGDEGKPVPWVLQLPLNSTVA